MSEGDGMGRTIDAPETIAMSKVRAFLAELGIDAKYLRELNVGMEGVYVEVVARDEKGSIYTEANGDIAMHRISMRLDRDA